MVTRLIDLRDKPVDRFGGANHGGAQHQPVERLLGAGKRQIIFECPVDLTVVEGIIRRLHADARQKRLNGRSQSGERSLITSYGRQERGEIRYYLGIRGGLAPLKEQERFYDPRCAHPATRCKQPRIPPRNLFCENRQHRLGASAGLNRIEVCAIQCLDQIGDNLGR